VDLNDGNVRPTDLRVRKIQVQPINNYAVGAISKLYQV